MEIIGKKQESKWKRRIDYFHQTNYSEVHKNLFPINAFSIKSSSCWVKTRINIYKADWIQSGSRLPVSEWGRSGPGKNRLRNIY